jgi:hypothetical protein
VGPGADFFSVYHAGVALEQGTSPYVLEENPRRTPYAYPFRYLPVVGQTIGAAASRVPPRVALWAWMLLTELALLAVALAIWRCAPTRPLAAGSICALLLSTPYFLELHVGQFTFMSVALVVLAALALDRDAGRWPVAGAWVAYAAAAMLKVFPLVAIPALVRSGRAWPAIVLAGGTVLLVSLLWFPGHLQDWEAFFAANFTQPLGGLDAGNYGLVYVVHLLGLVGESQWGAFLTVWRAVVLGGAAGLVFLTRHRSLSLGVAVMLLAHFCSYVHVWEHHMSAVALLGVLVLIELARYAAPRWVQGVVVVCLILLVLPTPFWLLDGPKDPSVFRPDAEWSRWVRISLAAAKAAPTSTLFGVVCWTLATANPTGSTWVRRGVFTSDRLQ